MMIAPNSRARKAGKESWEVKVSMAELEERRRGMLTTVEGCNPDSHTTVALWRKIVFSYVSEDYKPI